MIIDVHTHAFPDKLAPRALEVLVEGAAPKTNGEGKPFTDGTVNGLLASMDRFGVDCSVICPVVTAPKQTPSINRFAKSLNENPDVSGRIVSFAGVYPGQDGWENYLVQIKEDGFKGLKIHTEYQGMDVDSKDCIALFRKAEELGLYVIMHAGEDIGVQGDIHSTPEKLSHVLQEVSGKYLIAAHMGGWNLWDDVEKYLVGTPVFFDTAFVSQFLAPEQALRIIRNHGADKILFGTDSPWEEPGTTIAYLESLGLSEAELRKIYSENILNLLKV